MLKCTIAIQKVNNIVINCLQNPYISIKSDKRQHNTIENWAILDNDFEIFLTTLIPNKLLQALYFHIFALGYLKDGNLYFKDITNTNNLILNLSVRLNCRPEKENKREEKEIDRYLKITDSEEGAVKKKNKSAKKRKA